MRMNGQGSAIIFCLLAFRVDAAPPPDSTKKAPAPAIAGPTISELQKVVDAQAAEVAKLKQAVLTIVPAGTVIASAVDAKSPPPPGWLVCNGQEISKADYPNLCAALGDTYGKSAEGKCRVPDYTGRFLRGIDVSGVRDVETNKRKAMFDGARAGAVVGSVQDAATSLAGISINGSNAMDGANAAAVYSGCDTEHEDTDCSAHEPNLHAEGSKGNHSHSLSGGGAETRPANATVQFLIRAF